jgi:hypothetical protein
VEIRQGQTAVMDIGVVRAASIAAKVAVYAAQTRNLTVDTQSSRDDQFTEVGALDAALVEITNGTETLRQTTDHNGLISFEHIRPGRWTLKVYGDNLPPHSYLETPESSLDLKPGEKYCSTFRVLPRHRRIQFIDHGSVEAKL